MINFKTLILKHDQKLYTSFDNMYSDMTQKWQSTQQGAKGQKS